MNITSAAIVMLVLGTVCECAGLLALSDRWRRRVPYGNLVLVVGACLWGAGLGLAVLGS